MNPISRFRTRARSDNGRSATDLPLRMYLPSVGESSRPRIDRSVDLPQPDGPAMAMYSPLLISRWIPARACVSTSSVKNTFVTPSRWMSDCADVFICAPCGWLRTSAFELYPVERIELRHVGQNDLVAGLESFEDLDGVHRGASELHLGGERLAARLHLEDRDGAVLLAERRASDEDDVVELLELDGAVDAQVRTRSRRQVAVHDHVDADRPARRGGVDAWDVPLDDAVAGGGLGRLAGLSCLWFA